jgi:hypothetical protein
MIISSNFEPYRPGIIDAFERAFERARQKQWDCIYIGIDIHDTIVHGNYDNSSIPTSFTPNALRTLQYLSNRRDIYMFLYTCSHAKEIAQYAPFFKENGIRFQAVNKNPVVENTDLGCYDLKPYFNVLIEDKAGFNCERDWLAIYNWFINNPQYLW